MSVSSTSPPAWPKSGAGIAKKTASYGGRRSGKSPSWRKNSQRQIDQLTQKIADTNSAITRMGDEMRAADRRLGERIEAVNDALSRRIAEMVSGIGEWMRTGGKQSNT